MRYLSLLARISHSHLLRHRRSRPGLRQSHRSDPQRAGARLRSDRRLFLPRDGVCAKCGLGLVLLLLVACSPEQRYSVLSVIFDGVPRPGDAPDETARVSPQFIGFEAARPSARLKLFRHQPTLNDRCDNCHPQDRLWLGETFDRDGGCFNCHEHDVFQDKLNRYSFLHGPVAVQACLACQIVRAHV